jgi:MFS transporter, SET family, sugar efflux transporter
MIRHVSIVAKDPTLRMIFFMTLFFGAFVASIGPYQSLVAIQVFGLSDTAYAIVLLLGLFVSIAASVGIGIVTDQRPSRRRMAQLAAWTLILGGALVWAVDSPVAFVIAHIVLIPVSGTLFGQLFAVTRLVSAPMPAADKDGVFAVLRAMMGLPWIICLPLWGLALHGGLPLIAIYPVLVVLGIGMLILMARAWPRDENAPWVEQKSGLGFRASLGEMMAGPVLTRVMLIGAIHAGGATAGVILGLCFAQAGRGTDDLGLFFGIFVAFEVVGMLLIGPYINRIGRLPMITMGTLTYAAFLGLLPFVVDTGWLWSLTFLGGFGGAMIYLPAMVYLQELLGNRAGAGASLVAVQRLSSDGLCAAIFAFGAWASGYGLVAILGAITTVAAVSILLWLERAKPIQRTVQRGH